jgi:phosphatidylserine/phosphatidylglycerophosphate/cardiolipin synthase-like enzyme
MWMGLLLATGFTGALTLRFLWAALRGLFVTPPSSSVHFSPKGGCTEAVVAELDRARREILVLAYSFTSRPITDALIAAHRRGVQVEIILDHSNEKEDYTDLPHLLEQGLKPLIDAHHAIAHNKIMVIDHRTIITGSFNFTHQAEQENAENLLILQNHSELAERYRHNFLNHKDHARAVEKVSATAQAAHRGGTQHRKAA